MKDGEKRSDNFVRLWHADELSPDVALGFDNMAALAVQDGKYRVIRNKTVKFPDIPNVHYLRRTEGAITLEPLPVSAEYQPFDFAA